MTRVVISGLGAVTPLGNDVASTWQAVLAGRSGIDYLKCLDAEAFDCAIGGEVHGDFLAEELKTHRDLRHMDRYCQFAVTAAFEALRDAGLDQKKPLGERTGVVFGAGSGGYHVVDEQWEILRTKGPRRVSPFFLTNILPDAASGYIAMLTGAMGPNMAVVSACATGGGSIGEAAEIIKRGDADVMIAGGAEAPLTPMLYAAFTSLRAIASAGDDPATACKPFDRRRDGFVVSEGSGAVILENLDHCLARGGRPYAELIGYGASNDAFDMVASEETGRGTALAMETALRKAAIEPTRIGYINAHGTGTPMNDRVETAALKRVFGEHAYRFGVSSTKALTGHMMGASGAIEAVFTVLALRDQILPGTMHYEESDPDCDLDYIPNQARRTQALEYALSNSIGLGGHNAALIFSRWD